MHYSKQFLNKTVTVQMDRPLGSKNPKWGYEYPVNYGFIPNTKAPDGEELDAYVLNISEPRETFTGTCIAIIHRTDDDDDKLVVIPDGKGLTNKEIETLTYFQEQYFTSVILRS